MWLPENKRYFVNSVGRKKKYGQNASVRTKIKT